MEQEILRFFEGVTMPQQCADQICDKAAKVAHRKRRKEVYSMRQTEDKGRFRGFGFAACIVALAAMGIWFFTPEQRIALQASEPTAPSQVQEPWLPYRVDASGRVILGFDLDLEITDQLSFDQPLIYCDMQENGTIQYLAVGRSHSGNGVGMYYIEYAENTGLGNGLSLNCQDENGTDYDWYTLGVEKMEQHVNAIQAGRHKNTAGSVTSGGRPRGLVERDGRLYFVDGDTEQDITDLISDDEPFLYSHVDTEGYERCIAIGGTFTPDTDLDGVYWAELQKDAILAENVRYASSCWIGGQAIGHWDNEADDYYGWYKKAKEYFGWPWD